MSTRRWVLRAVLALAGLELGAAARAYRRAIAPQDWARAAERAAAVPVDEPVLVAESWLGPRARQAVPATARWNAVAAPDLWGLARVHVVGLEPWSPRLTAALEGRTPPALAERIDVGGLTWATYEFAAPQRVAFDLVRDGPARVTIDGLTCRPTGAAWRCSGGDSVAVRTAEIDYQPRRCLALAVADGAQVTLSFQVQAGAGATLRGHVGFSDFNARLRSDAPVGVVLRVDDGERGRFVATDAQGWLPFVAALEPGPHPVEVRVSVPAAGTWQRDGYGLRARHLPCLELRLVEPAREGAP